MQTRFKAAAARQVTIQRPANNNRKIMFSARSDKLVVGQSPAGKNVSKEAEDIVGSVTRQRLVKT
jgi:hypothetical protein